MRFITSESGNTAWNVDTIDTIEVELKPSLKGTDAEPIYRIVATRGQGRQMVLVDGLRTEQAARNRLALELRKI